MASAMSSGSPNASGSTWASAALRSRARTLRPTERRICCSSTEIGRHGAQPFRLCQSCQHYIVNDVNAGGCLWRGEACSS